MALSFKRLLDFKLPLILIAEILFCLLFGDMISPLLKSIFYSVSLLLKDILITALPFIIFAILCANLSSLSKGAVLFTIMAFSSVILSNFASTLLSGTLGTLVLQTLTFTKATPNFGSEIGPIWALPLWEGLLGPFAHILHPSTLETLPVIKQIKLVSNDMGLVAGIITGLFLSIYPMDWAKKGIVILHGIAFGFFRRFFIPVLPVFILGYVLNMQQTGVLDKIFENYAQIVLIITLFVFAYIVFLYGVASSFNPKKWTLSIKRLIPAALTGFSTMSSASALPLVIEGVRQNSKRPDQALEDDTVTGIVPLSINIHLIGDCFAIPILALAILVSFGMGLPSVIDFFVFTVFFVFAKFAVAAVPGGGILVMIPILETYLGFTPEMIVLITSLYILFDPIITSANIFGNGAFAGIFNRVFRFYQKVLMPKRQNKKIASSQ